ncbi:hypothetical protein LEP1GSC059_2611 [Leptospira noguchii serovar Panama str. CZ214]|uniref:Uncharacterized protein n=1 Tax=Leptospira noguchii serovar Panama str. CZ214 TaxID=1001595 RepID=T0GQU1_9LEPT|nr:hypothetical protein LEP1GSC059_2611 [Leptospira noguchii serovar Panama str. CZ214]
MLRWKSVLFQSTSFLNQGRNFYAREYVCSTKLCFNPLPF